MNTKTIMGVDVGMTRFGVAVFDPKLTIPWGAVSYKTVNFTNFYKKLKVVMEVTNPDLVVTCRPTRFGKVVARHNQLIGVLMLLCEGLDTQLVIETDTECRGILFGKMPRKGAKNYAHKLLGDEFNGDKDAADAWIMAKAYHKKLS